MRNFFFREKIRRAKDQLELNLTTAIEDNKYIINKMKTKENLHSFLLNEEGSSVNG